jgi:hypothetical protein
MKFLGKRMREIGLGMEFTFKLSHYVTPIGGIRRSMVDGSIKSYHYRPCTARERQVWLEFETSCI